MALKIESKLFSGYFVSVSRTLTEGVHMQVALHLHTLSPKCNVTSRFFLMLPVYTQTSVYSESTTRDQGGNDKPGWGGISVVLLLYIKAWSQAAKAARFKRRKKGVSIHPGKQRGGEEQPNQNYQQDFCSHFKPRADKGFHFQFLKANPWSSCRGELCKELTILWVQSFSEVPPSFHLPEHFSPFSVIYSSVLLLHTYWPFLLHDKPKLSLLEPEVHYLYSF